MALDQEIAVFQRELPGLLHDHAGKFALVYQSKVDSVWGTLDEALEAGYYRFGLNQFLVKQIVEHEEPQYCSRNVRCRSLQGTSPTTVL